MATREPGPLLIEEVSDFLATSPSPEQFLSYRPSPRLQKRLRELLSKVKKGRTTADDEWELDQFEHAETLMQLVKAKLR